MQRTLEDLKPVLKDPSSQGPSHVYQVFPSDKENWVNKTVVEPGKIGEEFTKTFGHYHPENSPPETYFVEQGEGILILQKKDLSKIVIVKLKAGDRVKITNQYGHSISNVGKEPLILYDDWKIPHTPADYEQIKNLHGMACYLVEEGGEVKSISNLNYQNLPQPVWSTPQDL